MSQPFVGEIRMFGGNFAPAGWMFCEGQLLAISDNDTLFTLIGTTYGGDGQTTFALPDLRGRIPVHPDSGNFQLGQAGGTETVTSVQCSDECAGHRVHRRQSAPRQLHAVPVRELHYFSFRGFPVADLEGDCKAIEQSGGNHVRTVPGRDESH